MEVKDAIAHRLSIRRYADSSIPTEHMETLFRALQLAPSANNGQNWEFIFVGDEEIKRRLVRACSNQSFVASCSYFIAGIADPGQKWHMVDITIALTNFTLQAAELGYGTCWIGAFDEDRVKEILGLPEEKKVVICMTFGTPEGRHVARGRKAFERFISLNHYGRRWSPNDPTRRSRK
ncbi:MAG: nitroreductase [bacterium]|nr:nitroreductase [bacterium]